MKKKKLLSICPLAAKCDVASYLSRHLVGPQYKNVHRRGFGAAIILVGTALVHVPVPGYGHIIAELFGWSIHAVGLIPFISTIETKALTEEIAPPPIITKAIKYETTKEYEKSTDIV